MAAAQAGAALPAHGVNLVDENDSGGNLLGLLKQVADAAGADAHIHLHKIGAGNGQELNPSLSRHRSGKQGLAGAGRAHQQNTVGNPGADLGEFLGIFQEVHNLLQFFLLLVCACHVVKSNLLPIRHSQHRPGLAEVVQGIPAIRPVHKHSPGKQQHQAHHQQGQNQIVGGVGLFRHEVIALQHTGFLLLLEQVVHLQAEDLGICQGCGNGGLPIVGGAEVQRNVLILHHKLANLLLPEQLRNLGVRNLVLIPPEQVVRPGEDHHQQHQVNNQRYESITVFQLGSPYFSYTSGFRTPI